MNTREQAVSDALKSLIDHLADTDEEGLIEHAPMVMQARAALAMPSVSVEPDTIQATDAQMIAANEALDYMGFALLRNGFTPTEDEVRGEALSRNLLVFIQASTPIERQIPNDEPDTQLTH